jgi:predicted nucleic acid-binding protein
MYTLTRGDDTAEPRELGDLAAAMAAAGRSDPADWLVTAGMPGQIITHWASETQHGDGETLAADGEWDGYLRRHWRIEAPRVAHELIGVLTGEQIASREWSRDDLRIVLGALLVLPPPRLAAFEVACLAAAHYAAAGDLTADQIAAAIARAYGGGAEPPDAVVAAAAVAASLTAEGFTVPGLGVHHLLARLEPGSET